MPMFKASAGNRVSFCEFFPLTPTDSCQAKCQLNIWSLPLPMWYCGFFFFLELFFIFRLLTMPELPAIGQSLNHPKNGYMVETNQTMIQFDPAWDYLFSSLKCSAVWFGPWFREIPLHNFGLGRCERALYCQTRKHTSTMAVPKSGF